MSNIGCLTPASEVRHQLQIDANHVTVEFQLDGVVYRRYVTVASRRVTGNGDEYLDCVLPNATMISLVLASADGGLDSVGIVSPDHCTSDRIINENASPSLDLLGLEEWLRWQQERILWGDREAVDDGPYAKHPPIVRLAARSA